MGTTNKIDQSRMMGTVAFKKEINHLLYYNSFTSSDGEFDASWDSRDHSLVHSKFGLIDVSPSLQTKEHRFREQFSGIFNRV